VQGSAVNRSCYAQDAIVVGLPFSQLFLPRCHHDRFRILLHWSGRLNNLLLQYEVFFCSGEHGCAVASAYSSLAQQPLSANSFGRFEFSSFFTFSSIWPL
ncbi:unnamed protein product, partial [Ectocarpus fasciculatus]